MTKSRSGSAGDSHDSVHDDRWTARVSDYIDGELPAADARAFEAHLASCDECTRLLGDMRAVVTQLREHSARDAITASAPLDAMWHGLAPRLDAAGRTSTIPERARLRDSSMPWQMLAAGLLLAVGLGAGTWVGSRPCVAASGYSQPRWMLGLPCRGWSNAMPSREPADSLSKTVSAETDSVPMKDVTAVLDSLLESARQEQRRNPSDSAIARYVRALETARSRISTGRATR